MEGWTHGRQAGDAQKQQRRKKSLSQKKEVRQMKQPLSFCCCPGCLSFKRASALALSPLLSTSTLSHSSTLSLPPSFLYSHSPFVRVPSSSPTTPPSLPLANPTLLDLSTVGLSVPLSHRPPSLAPLTPLPLPLSSSDLADDALSLPLSSSQSPGLALYTLLSPIHFPSLVDSPPLATPQAPPL